MPSASDVSQGRNSARAARTRPAREPSTSMPVTSAPSACRRSQSARPMNPPAPVTATRVPARDSFTAGTMASGTARRRSVCPLPPPLWCPCVRARALRAVAWGAVCAGIALPLARRRLGLPPAAAAAASIAAPFGLAVATERSPRRDVAVYVLQMWAYIILHELPNDDPGRLERRVLVEYPIEFDRRVLRAQPNVVLQRKLARPGDPRALDYALTAAHWAWFVQPHATAAWILWKHPERFERTAVSMAAVFDLGLLGYFAVPTAPPWWAAEKGHIEGLHRIMEDVG